LNVPEDAEVLTLDLDEDLARQAEQHPVDAELTRMHLKSKVDLDFFGSPALHKICQLTGNSVEFDFRKWRASIDVVLIDGGHDLATVKADTENAFDIVARDRPACILWHDYGNGEYKELTSYLDGLADTSDMFHVEDTMLCIWFNDPEGSIVRTLLEMRQVSIR